MITLWEIAVSALWTGKFSLAFILTPGYIFFVCPGKRPVTTVRIYLMPGKRIAELRESRPPEEQEEAEPVTKRPRLEPAEAEAGAMAMAMEQGRPYSEFVEKEARKYWEEMVKVGSLNKPDRDEIRTAAIPLLCKALRNRPGSRRHQAVNAMQLHAVESGWIKHPFTLSEASPDYVEALVQLAEDAGWGLKEVRLPRHPAPHHPPIYYSIEPGTNRPKPREDCLIRGDFVYGPSNRLLTRDDSLTRMDLRLGSTCRRITMNEYIHPLPHPTMDPHHLFARGWDAAYTLGGWHTEPEVIVCWPVHLRGMSILRHTRLSELWFSRWPPGFFTD